MQSIIQKSGSTNQSLELEQQIYQTDSAHVGFSCQMPISPVLNHSMASPMATPSACFYNDYGWNYNYVIPFNPQYYQSNSNTSTPHKTLQSHYVPLQEALLLSDDNIAQLEAQREAIGKPKSKKLRKGEKQAKKQRLLSGQNDSFTRSDISTDTTSTNTSYSKRSKTSLNLRKNPKKKFER